MLNKSKVYLALGSNVGEKFQNLQHAINLLNDSEGVEVIAHSSTYITKPYGVKTQSDFLNLVIEISTSFSPDQLFALIKTVEKKLGRIDRGKWNAREIDIDILLYADLVVDEPHLRIPHYELANRDFFVIPLIEINSQIINPLNQKYFAELQFDEANRYIVGKYSKSIEMKLNV